MSRSRSCTASLSTFTGAPRLPVTMPGLSMTTATMMSCNTMKAIEPL